MYDIELYYPNNYRLYTMNAPFVHILYNLNEHLQQLPVMCAFDVTNRIGNWKLRPERRGQKGLNTFSCALLNLFKSMYMFHNERKKERRKMWWSWESL